MSTIHVYYAAVSSLGVAANLLKDPCSSSEIAFVYNL